MTRRATKVDAHVGARLRSLRRARDMAQADLGKRLDVSYSQVQKYERGTDRVSAGRLFELAKVFAVPIGAFFEGL